MGKKIFSGENLSFSNRNPYLKNFHHNFKYVDLSMSFKKINHYKYLRFPLWILYLIPPHSQMKEIREIVHGINKSRYAKTKECALIARHDKYGTRSMIVEKVKKFVNNEYAGQWRNNTKDLWEKYQDNKVNI